MQEAGQAVAVLDFPHKQAYKPRNSLIFDLSSDPRSNQIIAFR